MKKILNLLVCCIVIAASSAAQYVTIPDDNFRSVLKYYYPTCFNSAGQMDTTCSEIVNEDSFTTRHYEIKTLEGIRYFKRLRYLDCAQIGYLGELPAMPDSLVYFNCSGSSGIKSLSPLPPTLRYLNCSYLYRVTDIPVMPLLERLECINCWGLTTIQNLSPSLKYLNCNGSSRLGLLPSLPSSLDTLSCSECGLQTLPVLPAGLQYLDCQLNPIRMLPALPNSLTYLNCSGFDMVPSSIPEYVDTARLDMPLLPSSLEFFSCYMSRVKQISALPNQLRHLECWGNELTSLPPMPASLLYLNCYRNRLHSLPALPNTLRHLDCSVNPLYSLAALPDSLRTLSCGSDSLTVLPALPANIDTLHCAGNQLTSLPALPGKLLYLNCGSNAITAFPPLPNSLIDLRCSSNLFKSLAELPGRLIYLDCSSNAITSLTLPGNLQTLYCGNNKLTSLPALPFGLLYIAFEWNDIYCLPELPNTGWGLSLRTDPYHLKCLPNIPANFYISFEDTANWNPNPWPVLGLCNPTNNIFNCQAFPVVAGNIFYDYNKNGIRDNGELIKTNTKIQLSNGDFTFSNSNGYFEIAADSIGAYTVTPVTPAYYYDFAPASASYNFTNYDTIVYKDYGLQVNKIFDSLSVRITPVNWAARPGFSFSYLINYENAGTTTLNSNIIFNYDNNILIYDSSSSAAVINNGNNLSLNTGSLAPGESGSFTAVFHLKTTAALNDTLSAKAFISGGAATSTDSTKTPIGGSFDPNDKQATSQLTPAQVIEGKYINYTIRFQNTGTDTAFNITIADTLSEQLQWNTLELIGTSYNCKTTVNGDKVYFEFFNILLPDSNRNEPASHGFVSFRIKPKLTVPANSTIYNTASIYFDYNAPVVTNTAGTLIQNFSTIPVRLVSFSAIPQPNNHTVLYWQTSNEINTSRFIIEQSTDGIHFISLSSVYAKGMQSNNYSITVADGNAAIVYYRIKMVDRDEKYLYSPVMKIDRRENGPGFSVLTNPVKDFIIINTKDRSLHNTNGSLISSMGATVKTFSIKEGSQTVAVSGLAKGIYYIKTINGSSRIIVQ
ncbi:MAG: hypothetical protein QM791_14940 [Ferruginibacter sp.]